MNNKATNMLFSKTVWNSIWRNLIEIILNLKKNIPFERNVEGLKIWKHCVLTLCNFSKAFDCVSPEILRKKMSFYAVMRVSCTFLRNRKQFVQTDNCRVGV